MREEPKMEPVGIGLEAVPVDPDEPAYERWHELLIDAAHDKIWSMNGQQLAARWDEEIGWGREALA